MHVCLDIGLYSHPKEFLRNGVRTHVNSKGKIPSNRKILLRGGSNPRRCIKQDTEPNKPFWPTAHSRSSHCISVGIMSGSDMSPMRSTYCSPHQHTVPVGSVLVVCTLANDFRLEFTSTSCSRWVNARRKVNAVKMSPSQRNLKRSRH